MCQNTEFFLVRIFPHSDWIRRDTSYLSAFSPNAVKYGAEKTPYLDTFHAVAGAVLTKRCFEIMLCNFIEITLPDGSSPVNLLQIFRTSFYKDTFDGPLLKFHYGDPYWTFVTMWVVMLQFQSQVTASASKYVCRSVFSTQLNMYNGTFLQNS